MSDIRWCFAHDEEPIGVATVCQRYIGSGIRGDCDIRDAVVLPKGEYYERELCSDYPMCEPMDGTHFVEVSDG